MRPFVSFLWDMRYWVFLCQYIFNNLGFPMSVHFQQSWLSYVSIFSTLLGFLCQYIFNNLGFPVSVHFQQRFILRVSSHTVKQLTEPLNETVNLTLRFLISCHLRRGLLNSLFHSRFTTMDIKRFHFPPCIIHTRQVSVFHVVIVITCYRPVFDLLI